MKELSIKEKAQRYEEAIEIARKRHKNPNYAFADRVIVEMFPELAESEDERIRKRIYDYINVTLDDNESEEKEKWLAFLSKQGGEQILANSAKTCKDEKKPTDKVEPKFHEGDWVVSKLDGNARQISEVHCDEYNDYYIVEGDEYQIEEYDRLHHLWTIQDAKDGDVLKEGSCIFILRKMKSKNTAITHCCLFDDGDFNLSPTLSLDVDSTFPATKEQRDLLFAKMKEAGYAFELYNKEMMKIEDELITDVEIPFGAKDSELKEVFYSIPNGFHAEIEDDKVVIKKGEKKPWSEEDEEIRNNCIYWLEKARKYFEKDEDLIYDKKWIVKYTDWLKSLRPQNHWKPSDEQIQCLYDAIEYYQTNGYPATKLKELHEQMQKIYKL